MLAVLTILMTAATIFLAIKAIQPTTTAQAVGVEQFDRAYASSVLNLNLW